MPGSVSVTFPEHLRVIPGGLQHYQCGLCILSTAGHKQHRILRPLHWIADPTAKNHLWGSWTFGALWGRTHITKKIRMESSKTNYKKKLNILICTVIFKRGVGSRIRLAQWAEHKFCMSEAWISSLTLHGPQASLRVTSEFRAGSTPQ